MGVSGEDRENKRRQFFVETPSKYEEWELAVLSPEQREKFEAEMEGRWISYLPCNSRAADGGADFDKPGRLSESTMKRVLPPIIPILFWTICCHQAVSKEQKPSAASRPPTTLDMQLIDENGKPVEGARVGVNASFGSAKLIPGLCRYPADGAGWRFF